MTWCKIGSVNAVEHASNILVSYSFEKNPFISLPMHFTGIKWF